MGKQNLSETCLSEETVLIPNRVILTPNHCQSLLKIVYSNLIWNTRDCIEILFPGFHCNRQVAFHQKSFLRILGVGQYKKGLFCNDFEVHSTATPTLVYSYITFWCYRLLWLMSFDATRITRTDPDKLSLSVIVELRCTANLDMAHYFTTDCKCAWYVFFARNLLDYSFESSDFAHVRCPKLPNISKYMHIRLYHH